MRDKTREKIACTHRDKFHITFVNRPIRILTINADMNLMGAYPLKENVL